MKLDKTALGPPRCALVGVALLGSSVLGGTIVRAQAETPTDKTVPGVAARPAPVRASGLTVSIDPVTKQIRPPTPAELKSLAALQAPARLLGPEAAIVRQYPNGVWSVRLPESFMETATVAMEADGTLSFQCGRRAAAVAANVTPASAPSQAGTQASVVRPEGRGSGSLEHGLQPTRSWPDTSTPPNSLEEK